MQDCKQHRLTGIDKLVAPMPVPEGTSAPGFTPVVENQPQMLTFLANGCFVYHPQVSSDKTGGGVAIPKEVMLADEKGTPGVVV